jgi:hypothetical protein
LKKVVRWFAKIGITRSYRWKKSLYLVENQIDTYLYVINKEGPHFREILIRGPERIRTAVEAFAELYLATRSQDLFCCFCANGKRK